MFRDKRDEGEGEALLKNNNILLLIRLAETRVNRQDPDSFKKETVEKTYSEKSKRDTDTPAERNPCPRTSDSQLDEA